MCGKKVGEGRGCEIKPSALSFESHLSPKEDNTEAATPMVKLNPGNVKKLSNNISLACQSFALKLKDKLSNTNI